MSGSLLRIFCSLYWIIQLHCQSVSLSILLIWHLLESFINVKKIAMWAWSYVWSLILALLICSSHLQLDNFCRVLQKSLHTTASPGQWIIFRNFSVTNRDGSRNTHWSGSHFELLSSQRIQAWYLKPFFMKLLQESIPYPLIPRDHVLMKLLIPYRWSGK